MSGEALRKIANYAHADYLDDGMIFDIREAAALLDWNLISDVPVPKDDMFLWGFWKQRDNGAWAFSIGMGYWTMSDKWACAYGSPGIDERATHWKSLGKPPTRRG